MQLQVAARVAPAADGERRDAGALWPALPPSGEMLGRASELTGQWAQVSEVASRVGMGSGTA